ncbi:MAG: DUF6346 domain-containing protein [Actinoplanes sp.]
MTDDREQRGAERRRRMDELLAQAETDVARTRAAKNEPPEPAGETVSRSRSAAGSALVVVVLLLAGLLLVGVALTLGRFTGADYAEARRQGVATVQECERRGPVTLNGFGYFDQCTVEIAWATGPSSRVLLDEPGFIRGEKPGDTFEIGENSGSRGSLAYSRPELPDRSWLGWLAAFVGFLGAVPVLLVLFLIKGMITDALRRR